MAELIGASMLFEYSKEVISDDDAVNFHTRFFQTDTSPVIWVMCQAFAFEERGYFRGMPRGEVGVWIVPIVFDDVS